ncbi:E3 ubiquitin-protein ligase listerin-like [Saccostrea cucullata]|uniref:E3 ubiquitin-protein ligase listerin-like n=1 Tax=Saccostrea cuccullata TaxID=36930 RepID=UPI002ECFF452
MPGHGSKKQAQRTKGNTKPSSSSEAAKLLLEAGTAPTGFIGFGFQSSSPGYVPVSHSLDDVDSSLDSDIRMVLRKLSKRDATTKVKALQEFSSLCKEKDEESVKAVLPYWPRIYNKMALDVDHRVREMTQTAMNTLVLRMRKNLAPNLKTLMGAWLLSQCDTYPTVATAAQQAFQTAFPPTKQTDALVFCKQESTEYLLDNILRQTPLTLSDPKTTEKEDMENKYNRVLTSSLLALRKLLTALPADQLTSLSDKMDSLLKDPKFWKHGKSQVISVQAAVYSFLAGLCQTLPGTVTQHSKKVSTHILHNIDETDAVICPCLWEAVLSLVSYIDDCWQHINVEKAFWPKLRKYLENGCHGNACLMGGDLLPFLSKVPPTLLGEGYKFYIEFFNYFKSGLSKDPVQASPSELGALVRAFFECAQFVIKSAMKSSKDEGLLEIMFSDQIMQVVHASLFESTSALHRTPLYSLLGNLLTSLETSDECTQSVSNFWSELRLCVSDRLGSALSSEERYFTDRLIQFVKCLIFPQSGNKAKTDVKVKVKFAAGDVVPGMEQLSVNQQERRELSRGAKEFVHMMTIKSFEMAHRNHNKENLHLFAALIELLPEEETIKDIIERCHGDVKTDQSHSSYFVFNVCLPWLHQSQALEENDSVQLISVICSFIPLLESSVVDTLLEELCKTITSFLVFYNLLSKMVQIQRQMAGVDNWLHSDSLGEKIVSVAHTVCEESLGNSEEDKIQKGWDILTLVLSAGIDRVKPSTVHGILQTIHKSLADLELNKDKQQADLAVKFVAKATTSFFLHLKDAGMLHAGEDLLVSLFSICADHSFQLQDSTRQEAEIAWTSGISSVVKETGGFLQEGSVLYRFKDVIQKQLLRTETMDSFQCLFHSTEKLLGVIRGSLPREDETEENPVVSVFLSELFIKTPPTLTKSMAEYCLVSGRLSYLNFPAKSDGSFNLTQTLYTTLFNVQLLLTSDYCYDNQEILLTVLESVALVLVYQDMEKRMLVRFADIIKGIETLEEKTKSVVLQMSHQKGNALINYTLDRCKDDGSLSLSLSEVLPGVLSDSENQVNVNSLVERFSELDEHSIQTLQTVAGHLDMAGLITLTEVMVARIISCDVENVMSANGGISALSVLNSALRSKANDEMAELGTSVLTQVMTWKDQMDDLLLCECNLVDADGVKVLANVEIVRFLQRAVQYFPYKLSDKAWDFILCTAVSLIQTVSESESQLMTSVPVQVFTLSVCLLVSEVAHTIEDISPVQQDICPKNLATEWEEFFSEGIFSSLLPVFHGLTSNLKKKPLRGVLDCLVRGVASAASYCPKQQVLGHKLPAYLIADQLSPLPDTLQSLLNHMTPCLMFPHRSVQSAAYHILKRVAPELPGYDKEETMEGEEEQNSRSPPVSLIQIITNKHSTTLSTVLLDLSVDQKFIVEPFTEIYQHVLAYLLSWKLLLTSFHHSPAELRSKYAAYLQENGCMNQLMSVIFRLMPEVPINKDKSNIFEKPFSLQASGEPSSFEICELACSVYKDALKTTPALVRLWWKDQDRKSVSYVDKFTSKYVSPVLCTEEISSLDAIDKKDVNFTVKTRPSTREVVAVHTLEEVCIEVVITLPQNYPLGNITVSSEKKVGVTAQQWDKWLLQLNIFLQHQNGSIMDGLRIWRRNIDKRFEGVDDCMICFSVLHGTNFQLPRLSCKTCKKKFHSACLYKWFQTSHNSTCPLCRNLF